MKVCSLVCQAFLPTCRKHIFGSIVLNDNIIASPTPTHALALLLFKSPEIANYIRKLDYTIETADLTSPLIQESLKRISRLEFLTVRDYNKTEIDWRHNPLRPALLHLLHLPTLTHFELAPITNFVVSDLIPCVNLKSLDIGFNTSMAVTTEATFPAALPEHPIQLNEFVASSQTSSAIMKLCTAQRADGQPIIDFRSLSEISVVVESRGEIELFSHCQALTDVEIYCR